MSDNPYHSPPDVAAFSEKKGGDPSLDAAVIVLRQTKPWVRFISVMMLIGSALMIMGGAFMIMSSVTGTMGGGPGPGPFTGFGVIMGLVYLGMAAFYLIPAIFLWRFADRIANFVREKSNDTLVSALEAQKSFWKFVGIIVLIVMAMYGIGIIFAMVAGILAAVAG